MAFPQSLPHLRINLAASAAPPLIFRCRLGVTPSEFTFYCDGQWFPLCLHPIGRGADRQIMALFFDWYLQNTDKQMRTAWRRGLLISFMVVCSVWGVWAQVTVGSMIRRAEQCNQCHHIFYE